MAEVRNWLGALSVVLAVFVVVEIPLAYRAVQMRALAKRLGWSYTAGNNHVWKVIFKQRKYPSDFWLKGDPMQGLWGMMNVIEGQSGSIRLVILDSLLHFGSKHDRYVTFIGARTESNPFHLRNDEEILVQSNGWCALYRLRFSLTTWSLSVERIEDHLRAIGIEKFNP